MATSTLTQLLDYEGGKEAASSSSSTHQQGEDDGDGLDGLDRPESSQAQHLQEGEDVHAPQGHVAQVRVVRLVLDRHEDQQQAVNQL